LFWPPQRIFFTFFEKKMEKKEKEKKANIGPLGDFFYKKRQG
jgi:hypothetical protein